MPHKRSLRLLVLATAALLAAGQAGAQTSVTVIETKPQHHRHGHDRQRHEAGCMAGTLGGAILGGVLGAGMGKGGGKTAATIGLAGLGGIAGNSLACE